jgi:hypothetical protein
LYILETKTKKFVKSQILNPTKDLVPRRKEGWSFNWLYVYKKDSRSIFALKEENKETIHGMLHLINDGGMLVMELIEVAPFNIGTNKMYDNVAGCLIAYACRESLKLETAYKGYLTFVSKTELINLYKEKYFATQTIGNRMYIDPLSGENLINTYLKNHE